MVDNLLFLLISSILKILNPWEGKNSKNIFRISIYAKSEETTQQV